MRKNLYFFVQKYIMLHKKFFIILYVTTMINNIIGLLPVYFMGNIINFVADKAFERVLETILLLLILFFCNALLSIIETYLSNLLNNEIMRNIKNDIYKKTMEITITEFQNLSSGHVISLTEGDTEKITDFFVSKIIGILVSLVTLIVSIIFLLKLSASLTIIAIALFPLGFLGNLICGKKINKKSQYLRKISDQNYNFLSETLNGLKEIKAYVIEQNMIKKFMEYTEKIQKKNMEISFLEITAEIFNMFISSISEWVIIGYGTWKIINNTFSIGAYVAFNGYLNLLFAAVKELLNINIIFSSAEVSFKRIADFFELQNEKNNRNMKIDFLNKNIIFDNVAFAYKENSGKVLNRLNVTFKKQSVSVIVGANGVGKSTILALIEQFYQPQAGEIYIGENNLKDIELKCLRNNIGLVQQHPIMLTGTLRENLEYGSKNVDNDILDQICAKVGLTEFVKELQYGYDTYLSEISGGQQQKIAIARVLIKNPSILLLDEVTSDLDGKSENEIIKLVVELAREKTIILISHRINAIINIPNIYVMEQGKIISQGNHQQLIKTCPVYSLLINSKEVK